MSQVTYCLFVTIASVLIASQAYPTSSKNKLSLLEHDAGAGQLASESIKLRYFLNQLDEKHVIPRSVRADLDDDDMDTAEAIIFRPLFVYRKYTAKRRRLQPRF